MDKPTLNIVATPIGNLSDITLRALETLKNVDIIACEDTRVTRKLLNHYQISKPMLSLHQHSAEKRFKEIALLLKEGKSIAVVTDAGTPGISDPGGRLVEYVIQKLGDQVQIIPMPGPTAFVAALSVCGFPTDEFVFSGFPPHKKGRQTFFKKISETETVVAFYESPHRILKALASLNEVCPERKLVICRELTKIYEETIRGTPVEVLIYYESHSDKVRGEFVVVVGPL